MSALEPKAKAANLKYGAKRLETLPSEQREEIKKILTRTAPDFFEVTEKAWKNDFVSFSYLDAFVHACYAVLGDSGFRTFWTGVNHDLFGDFIFKAILGVQDLIAGGKPDPFRYLREGVPSMWKQSTKNAGTYHVVPGINRPNTVLLELRAIPRSTIETPGCVPAWESALAVLIERRCEGCHSVRVSMAATIEPGDAHGSAKVIVSWQSVSRAEAA